MGTTLHTCGCSACGGFSFYAPEGYIPTGRQYRTMVHNYAQMLRNPMLRAAMAARGMRAA